jgi:hypothetical protein
LNHDWHAALTAPKYAGKPGRYETDFIFRSGQPQFGRPFVGVAKLVPVAARRNETKLAIIHARKQNVSVFIP